MRVLWVFLLFFCAVASALAQYGNGVVLGTVTDASGGVVPNVAVTLTSHQTDESRRLSTGPSGDFRFSAVAAGTYTLVAKASGFSTTTIDTVTVTVNMETRADITMKLGAVTQNISVTGASPLLQTGTAAIGSAIEQRTMMELPLSGRDFFSLVALIPGATKVPGGSSVMDGLSVQIGGIRNTSTNTTFNGVDFTVQNVFNPAIGLSLDMLQEFHVEENFMDASYGHGGSLLELVSKTGTNRIHGVVYDFDRNRVFDADHFFRAFKEPRLSYNEFGVDFGGPIKRDKLFYFLNYQGRRDSTGDILLGNVPTAAEYQGSYQGTGITVKDPANGGTPFADDMIPNSRFDPVAKAMLAVASPSGGSLLFPTPNLTGRAGFNFITTPADVERRDQGTARIDISISPSKMLFGSFTAANDNLGNAGYIPDVGVNRPDATQFFVLGFTWLESPTFIGETRLGFTHAFLARDPQGNATSTNYASQVGLENLAATPGSYTYPYISLSSYTSENPSTAGATSAIGSEFGGAGTQIVQNNLYYRAGQTFTWTKGTHTIKFGGDWNRLMVGYDTAVDQDGIFSFGGTFTGNSLGDFLLGLPLTAAGGLGTYPDFPPVEKYSLGTQYNAYFQDDWKATSRLTVNMGLRYEIFQQWRGRLANFDLATGRQLIAGSADYYTPTGGLVIQSGPALLPERPLKTDPYDFGPRLGLAYRLGNKTTIRAGAGIFYALASAGTFLTSLAFTPPFYITDSLTSSSATPQLSLSQLFPPVTAATQAVTENVDLNKRDGLIGQWNFNIQHELSHSLLAEVGYMGNDADKQYATHPINQPTLPTTPTPEPSFASRDPYPALSPTFVQAGDFEWSDYNALYGKLQERLRSGLSFIFSYTYSKCMESESSTGNIQDAYDLRLERARCDTNVPQNFTASYVYNLPFGQGRRFGIGNPILDGFLGGWELTGITSFVSGFPLNITTTGDIAEVGTGNQRANGTGVPTTKLNPRTNGLKGFDTAAFATPAKGTFGNLARNAQQGFGVNDWDMGLDKNFAFHWLGDQGRLQFRFEFFNIWNHAQFTTIGTTENVPATFGYVSATNPPRTGQFAVKLYW